MKERLRRIVRGSYIVLEIGCPVIDTASPFDLIGAGPLANVLERLTMTVSLRDYEYAEDVKASHPRTLCGHWAISSMHRVSKRL